MLYTLVAGRSGVPSYTVAHILSHVLTAVGAILARTAVTDVNL